MLRQVLSQFIWNIVVSPRDILSLPYHSVQILSRLVGATTTPKHMVHQLRSGLCPLLTHFLKVLDGYVEFCENFHQLLMSSAQFTRSFARRGVADWPLWVP